MSLNSTGAVSKARVKEGDALIPKTTFGPIAAPGKLHGLKAANAEELKRRMPLVYEDLVRIFVAAKTPITLWGPAGSGKTRTVEAMAGEVDEHGTPYQVITMQPSTTDPTVIHGMMTITVDPRTGSKIMERSIPEPAEAVWRGFNDRDCLTIFFLDEMTTCNPAQQNAMLGLLTHGKFGDRDISPYTTFVMAANPPGTVRTVLPLSEAVINRGGHIPWYTDRNRWLDLWSGGFGDRAKSPRPRTTDFMTGLINSDPEIAFRDDPEYNDDPEDGWSIDNLCPYEDMELSARAATEAAKIYDVITDTFAEAPFDVRKLYIQEAITAMIGPRWGRHAGAVEEKLESVISTKPVINAIIRASIRSTSTYEEIMSAFGDSLHRIMGRRMRSQQELELAKAFQEEIFRDGAFSHRAYLAFWAWIATSPEESTRALIIPVALNILSRAGEEYRDEMSRTDLVPTFIPTTIKEEMKSVSYRAQDMADGD